MSVFHKRLGKSVKYWRFVGLPLVIFGCRLSLSAILVQPGIFKYSLLSNVGCKIPSGVSSPSSAQINHYSANVPATTLREAPGISSTFSGMTPGSMTAAASTTPATFSSSPSTSCLVRSPAGTFQGSVATSVLSQNVSFCIFSGIRYGNHTDRFADPVAAEPLSGVNMATNEGSPCPQCFKGINFGSEDCLFLNVYTPIQASGNRLKPVIVYIPGGAYISGAGSKLLYSPDLLIGYDVLLVAMYYRLAAFGFLSLGIPGAPGNIGLLDQLLALKWVQKNIRSFGGDPNNVTLYGQSAGSWAVPLHVLSPKSRGLFSKAIYQSPITSELVRESTVSYSIGLAKFLGYAGNLQNRNDMLRFLKGLSTVQLSDGFERFRAQLYKADAPFDLQITPLWPVVDGYRGVNSFLPQVLEILNKSSPVIPCFGGQTNADGTVDFFTGVPNAAITNVSSLDNILAIPGIATHILFSSDVDVTIAHLKNNIALYLDRTFGTRVNNRVAGAKVLQFYFGRPGVNEVTSAVQLYQDLQYSNFYKQITLFKSPQTYLYQFCFEGTFQNDKRVNMGNRYFPQTRGVGHGDDQAYSSFYSSLSYPIFSPTENDLKVIRQFTALLINFVKSGNPNIGYNTGLREEWKPSTRARKSYLRIDLVSRFISTRINEDRLEFLDSLYGRAD